MVDGLKLTRVCPWHNNPVTLTNFKLFIKTMKEFLEKMVTAYLECALWSSTDETGEPIDKHGTIKDFSKKALEKAKEDCKNFLAKCGDIALTANQLGHNFWLNRNRHGAGFWDMGLGQKGQNLSDLSHTFGECNVYIGDDGEIELS